MAHINAANSLTIATTTTFCDSPLFAIVLNRSVKRSCAFQIIPRTANGILSCCFADVKTSAASSRARLKSQIASSSTLSVMALQQCIDELGKL